MLLAGLSACSLVVLDGVVVALEPFAASFVLVDGVAVAVVLDLQSDDSVPDVVAASPVVLEVP